MADMRLLVPLALPGIGFPGTSRPPAATPSTPGDTLVIGVVYENGSLIPIARYAGGAWNVVPWSEPFGYEDDSVIAADGTRLWPERDTVDTRVPSSWLLYSHGARGTPMATGEFRLGKTYCMVRWELTTDRRSLQSPEGSRFAGVAMSQPPDTVLSEEDIAGLEQIRVDLDLTDRPSGGDGVRTFRWLGFFRIQGLAVGVVHGEGWEGEFFLVVALDGTGSRILAQLHGGGC